MDFISETIGEILKGWAGKTPDRDFIVYADRDLRFTYAEFDRRATHLANGLKAIGLDKGDHLGVWANNVPDWLTLLFATARMGIVLVTVSPMGVAPLSMICDFSQTNALLFPALLLMKTRSFPFPEVIGPWLNDC